MNDFSQYAIKPTTIFRSLSIFQVLTSNTLLIMCFFSVLLSFDSCGGLNEVNFSWNLTKLHVFDNRWWYYLKWAYRERSAPFSTFASQFHTISQNAVSRFSRRATSGVWQLKASLATAATRLCQTRTAPICARRRTFTFSCDRAISLICPHPLSVFVPSSPTPCHATAFPWCPKPGRACSVFLFLVFYK